MPKVLGLRGIDRHKRPAKKAGTPARDHQLIRPAVAIVTNILTVGPLHPPRRSQAILIPQRSRQIILNRMM